MLKEAMQFELILSEDIKQAEKTLEKFKKDIKYNRNFLKTEKHFSGNCNKVLVTTEMGNFDGIVDFLNFYGEMSDYYEINAF